MVNTLDYTNYRENQCEWARALTALARRMEKDEARDLAEIAAQALKRAVALHRGAERSFPLPKR